MHNHARLPGARSKRHTGGRSRGGDVTLGPNGEWFFLREGRCAMARPSLYAFPLLLWAAFSIAFMYPMQ